MLRKRLFEIRATYGPTILATGLRMIDLPCRYGMHVLVALKMPLGDVGAFYIVFGLVTLAAGFGRLGIDRATTREMARQMAQGNSASAARAMWRSMALVMGMSVLLALAVAALAWPLAQWVLGKGELTRLIVIGAASIVPLNLTVVIAGALAGLDRLTLSQTVYTWLWPALFCGLALMGPMSAGSGLAIFAISTALASLVALAMLGACLLRLKKEGAVTQPAPLFAIGFSLFSLELVQLGISSAPPFVLGALSTTADVGLYAVAWRVVLVVNLFISSVAFRSAPRFARLHVLGDTEALRTEAGNCVALAVALASVPMAVMAIWPGHILGLFGHSYASAAGLLRLLLIGQVAAMLTAGGSELLGMAGHTKALLRVNTRALVVLLITLPLFSHLWGARGSGLAVSLTMVVMALWIALATRRTCGFMPLEALYRLVGNARRGEIQAAA